MTARVDLHVHSKHSNQPSEWYLRGLQAPESFTEPLEIYRLAKRRGMRFVTISDHDSVDGALAIAHLPDTFLSSEVTVTFPEDGCDVHCLVIGVTEEQHREIQRRRRDIYAFRNYLLTEDILHSVAHPLYRVNDRLTLDHLEKLLVLFQRFEARNGIHHRRSNALVERLFGALSPELIERFADRHDLEPIGEAPWSKHFTGGSDDHGGFYIATTWTETPATDTVDDFLDHLRAGASVPGGGSGSSRKLARSLYAISDDYCRDRFGATVPDPFRQTLTRLAERRRRPTVWVEKLWERVFPPRRPTAADSLEEEAEHEQKAFRTAHRTTRRALHKFLREVVREAHKGHLTGCLAALGELSPAFAAAAPYVTATRAQFKDRDLERRAAVHLEGTPGPQVKAWVTDTITDVNGVSRTVSTVSEIAHLQGREIVPVVCGSREIPSPVPTMRFRPLVEAPLPGYETLKLSIPSPFEVLDRFESSDISELLISTPGPLGLLAVGLGDLLRLRRTGIYHTDFPAYLRDLFGDPCLEDLTWAYMAWFYGQMDRVYVPSRTYLEQLLAHGLPEDKLLVMPRAVDTEQFTPLRRDPDFWSERGARETFRFLYVGRISKEKNLQLLLDAFSRFLGTGRRATLVLVGDGPDRIDLERRARHPEVLFTGVLHGDELAAAYANADVFVFPSITDTFGNAVLEACASGVPVLVTDRGGPREIVHEGDCGRVVTPEPGPFADAMAELYDDEAERRKLAARGVAHARSRSWNAFLDDLWRRPIESAEAASQIRNQSVARVRAKRSAIPAAKR